MAVFHCPTKLCSGTGALKQLTEYRAQRVLIVTDSFFSGNGKAAEIGNMVKGAEVRIFDRVIPDPPAALAAEGAALCEEWKPQLLIALGGGSPMDCAKGIRAAYSGELIFIAIPTTSGSGSEVTSFSILTHEGVKYPLVSTQVQPDVAILDDSLLCGLPPTLIADTGMDLLAHCLEALVAEGRSGFTDALAIYGMRTALELLPPSYQGETKVRLALHEAASMAGMAFTHAGLGVCHALAHAIGGVLHLPHGRICAMLLPSVLAYNASMSMHRYAEAARQCGLQGATDRIALRNLTGSLVRLRRSLQLPENLSQAGIEKADWQRHLDGILDAALADPCCRTNPVPVTREGLRTILKAVEP